MSTRYVWKQYKSTDSEWGPNEEAYFVPIPLTQPSDGTVAFPAGYVGDNIAAEDGSSILKLSSSTAYIRNGSVLYAQTPTKISKSNSTYTPYKNGNTMYAYAQGSIVGSTSSNYAWVVTRNPNGTGTNSWALMCMDMDHPNDESYRVVTYYNRLIAGGKGDFICNVSSGSSSAYPTTSGGAVSKGYWYEYQGSDSIDPISISSYPASGLKAGQSITVTVTPGRSSKYGGTISYQYEYSVNGGSWTTIQTTASTSISFTIPANAAAIRFRAKARDDMGFTSADYVTTASVEMERLNLWAGVNGKARKGTALYVGVNGKARKVTAAYVGVNGKARRFL